MDIAGGDAFFHQRIEYRPGHGRGTAQVEQRQLRFVQGRQRCLMHQAFGVVRVTDVGEGSGEIEVFQCHLPLGGECRQVEIFRGAGAPEQADRVVEVQGDQAFDHGLYRGETGGATDKPHRLFRGAVDKAHAGGQGGADGAG